MLLFSSYLIQGLVNFVLFLSWCSFDLKERSALTKLLTGWMGGIETTIYYIKLSLKYNIICEWRNNFIFSFILDDLWRGPLMTFFKTFHSYLTSYRLYIIGFPAHKLLITKNKSLALKRMAKEKIRLNDQVIKG